MKTKPIVVTALLTPAILSALLLGLVVCGCRVAMPKRKFNASVHSTQDVAATYNQVRLRIRSLVGPMCGEIEQTADHIIAGTTNAAVQRAALIWKIDGVPALRAALFQPDAYTALADTWVLCNQMADYFETGPGKASLGESAPQAVAACRRLEEQMNSVAASVTISGDVTKVRAYAKKWAGEHPIRHSIADRESTLSRALEREIAASMSTGEAVAEITTTMDDLNRRLEVYSEQLFRQARWEAELFKSELMAEPAVAQALPLAERAAKSVEQAASSVDRLAPGVERVAVAVESLPKAITVEREAAVKAVDEELTRTLSFVQAQRVVAFEQLTKERVAAMNELHEAIVVERKLLTADIEQISLRVVDHALWREAQLVAVVLVLLVIGAAAVLFILKRPRTEKNPSPSV